MQTRSIPLDSSRDSLSERLADSLADTIRYVVHMEVAVGGQEVAGILLGCPSAPPARSLGAAHRTGPVLAPGERASSSLAWGSDRTARRQSIRPGVGEAAVIDAL